MKLVHCAKVWVRIPLLALLLLAQCGALVHLAAERHEVCADHGDLLSSETPAAIHGADPASDEGDASHPAQDRAGERHHCPHCSSARVAPDPTTTDVPSEAAVSTRHDDRGVVTIRPEARIPLYRLAPKNSPPKQA